MPDRHAAGAAPAPPAGPRPRPVRAAAGWALAFLATRLLAMAVEAPRLHRLDELYAGAAGLEIAAGRWSLPWPLLAHAPYCGGSMLVALAAALTFPRLGASVLVLRLPSLLVAVATFLVWRALVGRLAGRRAALVFAALAVAAPVEAVKLDLLAWGNHAESRLPTALGLLALLPLLGLDRRAVAEPVTPRRAERLALLAGMAAGAALFFSYAAMAFAAGAALLLVIRVVRRAQPWPLLLLHGFGLLLGALPAAALALARGLEGPSFLLPLIGRLRGGQAAANLWRLARYGLRDFLLPDAGLPRALEALPWIGVLAGLATAAALAAAAGAARRRLSPEALVVLPALAFLAVFAVSGLPIGGRQNGMLAFRYLAPLFPFLLAAVALVVARAPGRAAVAVTAALALPALARYAATAGEATLLPLRLSGASYLAYGGHLLEVVDFDPHRVAPLLAAVPAGTERKAAWAAVGTVAAAETLIPAETRPWAGIGALARDLPADATARAVCLRRLGLMLESDRLPPLDDAGLVRTLAVLAPIDGGEQVVAGAFSARVRGASGRPAAILEEAARLPLDTRFQAWAGIGRGDGLARRPPAADAPPSGPLRGFYLHGFGEGRTRRILAACTAPIAVPGAAGEAALPPLPADVDAAIVAGGAARALLDFEPEDPARRQYWAWRCAIVLHAAHFTSSPDR